MQQSLAQTSRPPILRARKRPRVVIIGGGFAGLHAARGLAHLPVDVILIDRHNHHTFQPLLYQVALGLLSPSNITQPIRAILSKQRNVEVLLDEAVSFELGRRIVQLASGVDLTYDYLIVAAGCTHSYFGRDEWAPLAPGLKSINDATEIRRRIITAFEVAERQASQTGVQTDPTFVVVGGGPTGVELAGAISDISKNFMHGSFRRIDPANAKVVILEGSQRILASYPEDLSTKAAAQLAHLGVSVRTHTRVTDLQPGCVYVGSEKIEASVILWGAGIQASPLGKMLGFDVDQHGRVIVDANLNPPGHPELFVCGDLAHVVEAGRQIPGVAQPAMQMGDYAAAMIGNDLKDHARAPFHYFDKGDMATIGRYAAVADVKWPFHAHWGGFVAWLSWLVVHLFFLLGFRNRISVLCEWMYGMFTSTCGSCIIDSAIGQKETHGGSPLASKPHSSPSTLHVVKNVTVICCLCLLGLSVACKDNQHKAGAGTQEKGVDSQQPMRVAVASAIQRGVSLTGEWVATTDGNVNAQIQPQVSGYIVRQDYKEGAKVTKDQVLFEIDPRTYEAQLDQVKASVAQAKASVEQAKAVLGLAIINVNRDTPLAKARAIAQSQLDNELQTQQADQASVDAAEAQVRSYEAQVRTAELNLSFTQVRSLISGVAGQAMVQVGNLVNTQSVLTSVSQINPIKIYFSLGEQEYLALSSRIKTRGKSDLLTSGNSIPLKLTLSNGEVYPETGRITFVDRSMSAQTGSIRLAALFANPRNLLRPGQFARVTAETDDLQNAIVIPQRAVNDMQGQDQVYVVAADNTVKTRSVQLGAQIGDDVVISSGLNSGERVATESLDKLKDGMKVQPQPGKLAMNRTSQAGFTREGAK